MDYRTVLTTCTYCGVGCQLNLHVQDNRVVKISGIDDVSPNYGSLCVKGRFGFDFISSPDRLTSPLIKENGQFREASWEEALHLVAGKFSEIQDQHGSESVGVLTSARITNEENYIAQKEDEEIALSELISSEEKPTVLEKDDKEIDDIDQDGKDLPGERTPFFEERRKQEQLEEEIKALRRELSKSKENSIVESSTSHVTSSVGPSKIHCSFM